MEFNKIVNKMSKLKGNIIDHEDILDIVDPGNARAELGKREAYKVTYALRSQGILHPIRNGLFVVMNADIKEKTEDEIIDMLYWKIVRKLILRFAQRDGIIVGTKSLELHLKDASIPSTLIVYTMSTNKVVSVSSGYKVQFRTVTSGKKDGRESMASFLLKFSNRMDIDDNMIRVANPEFALLDSLIAHKGSVETDEYLIRKFLKRHSKGIDRDILGALVAKKYITAANRLRSIAMEIGDTALYQKALDTIKREGGGCFRSV